MKKKIISQWKIIPKDGNKAILANILVVPIYASCSKLESFTVQDDNKLF